MKIDPNAVPAPIVTLATLLIDDVCELCTRMAIINQHEILLEPVEADDDPSGSDD